MLHIMRDRRVVRSDFEPFDSEGVEIVVGLVGQKSGIPPFDVRGRVSLY